MAVTIIRVPHVNDEGAVRFSISIPGTLAKQLDRMVSQRGYDNRSLAVADMIRAHLVQHQ